MSLEYARDLPWIWTQSEHQFRGHNTYHFLNDQLIELLESLPIPPYIQRLIMSSQARIQISKQHSDDSVLKVTPSHSSLRIRFAGHSAWIPVQFGSHRKRGKYCCLPASKDVGALTTQPLQHSRRDVIDIARGGSCYQIPYLCQLRNYERVHERTVAT